MRFYGIVIVNNLANLVISEPVIDISELLLILIA